MKKSPKVLHCTVLFVRVFYIGTALFGFNVTTVEIVLEWQKTSWK